MSYPFRYICLKSTLKCKVACVTLKTSKMGTLFQKVWRPLWWWGRTPLPIVEFSHDFHKFELIIFQIRLLTLKCLSYFSLTFVHKRLWPPSCWVLFPKEFLYETCTICVYTQNNHISAKRTIKKCFVSKWRPKNELSFREKSHVTKIWKTKR